MEECYKMTGAWLVGQEEEYGQALQSYPQLTVMKLILSPLIILLHNHPVFTASSIQIWISLSLFLYIGPNAIQNLIHVCAFLSIICPLL